MSKLDADAQKLSRAMDFTLADTIRFLATRRHFAVAMDFLHSVSDKRYRDTNAAQNILAAGLAVLACGEAVRPGRKQSSRQGKLQRSRKAN